MLVGWGQDGKPELRMDFTREFAKGMHDSRNKSDPNLSAIQGYIMTSSKQAATSNE